MPRGNEPRFDHGDRTGDLGDFNFIGHWLSFLGEPQQEEEMQIGFNLPISGPCEAKPSRRLAGGSLWSGTHFAPMRREARVS